MTLPRIDPSVRHISIGQLRKEKDFTDTLVVSDGPLPVAVVVPYAIFLEMQRCVEAPPQSASMPLIPSPPMRHV